MFIIVCIFSMLYNCLQASEDSEESLMDLEDIFSSSTVTTVHWESTGRKSQEKMSKQRRKRTSTEFMLPHTPRKKRCNEPDTDCKDDTSSSTGLIFPTPQVNRANTMVGPIGKGRGKEHVQRSKVPVSSPGMQAAHRLLEKMKHRRMQGSTLKTTTQPKSHSPFSKKRHMPIGDAEPKRNQSHSPFSTLRRKRPLPKEDAEPQGNESQSPFSTLRRKRHLLSLKGRKENFTGLKF